MPNYTTHLQLEKPLPNESADITVINSNMDKIDTALQEVKEEVERIDLSADQITVTDSQNLFQSDKLDGVLVELFTNADNGKKAIANVVGAPLTSADVFSQMTSEIQSMKNTFAMNLVNKGVSANGAEPLQTLVAKVPNIQTLPRQSNGTFTGLTFDKTDLGFKPSVIIVRAVFQRDSSLVGYWETHKINHVSYGDSKLKTSYYSIPIISNGEVTRYNESYRIYDTNGITILANGFRFSESINTYAGATFEWFAYE